MVYNVDQPEPDVVKNMTKKETIKAVSIPLFARNGYEGTSLSQIAKKAGIKPPSIYAHFDGKEDLFLSVFEDVLWEDVQYVKQLLEKQTDLSVEEKLYQILWGIFHFYLQNEEKAVFLKRVMLFPPSFLEKGELHKRFMASEQALSEILRSIFNEGMAKGIIRQHEVEDLIASFYCLVDGLFMQFYYYGKDEAERRLQKAWGIFWAGIRAEKQGSSR